LTDGTKYYAEFAWREDTFYCCSALSSRDSQQSPEPEKKEDKYISLAEAQLKLLPQQISLLLPNNLAEVTL